MFTLLYLLNIQQQIGGLFSINIIISRTEVGYFRAVRLSLADITVYFVNKPSYQHYGILWFRVTICLVLLNALGLVFLGTILYLTGSSVIAKVKETSRAETRIIATPSKEFSILTTLFWQQEKKPNNCVFTFSAGSWKPGKGGQNAVKK